MAQGLAPIDGPGEARAGRIAIYLLAGVVGCVFSMNIPDGELLLVEEVSRNTSLELGEELSQPYGECAELVFMRPSRSSLELSRGGAYDRARWITDQRSESLEYYDRTAPILDPRLWERVRPSRLPALVIAYRGRVVYSGDPGEEAFRCQERGTG